MLQTMHAALNGLLYLIGHAQPPEVLPLQRQGMVAALMTQIPMAVIQGGDTMGLRDHKEKRSLVSPLGVDHKYKALR